MVDINNNLTEDLTTRQTLNQSTYNFTNRVFPSDLDSETIGHYVVFNINVQTTSSGETRGAVSNRFSTVLQNEFSKVDTLKYGNYQAISGLSSTTQSSVLSNAVGLGNFTRGTRRIAESIAIHMPTPLVFNSQNIYEDISMTALAGNIGVSLANLVPFGGSIASSIIGGGSQGAQIFGSPINPAVEVLFATTMLRQFTFEFMMAPRNKAEADAMTQIIKAFRFYSAPELDNAGFTFIPPSEFDITFYNKGEENLYIPRINTCALERVEVDYAPSGIYSTFSTGHPVTARLSLGFRELEIVHKRRVAEGF